VLTAHQLDELKKVESSLNDSGRAVLKGAAGTGKTFCMKHLTDKAVGEVTLLAPTGKAASVLREKTGLKVDTIHSALYKTVQEDEEGNPIFTDPAQLGNHGGLVIIDEASMVGSDVVADLLSKIHPSAALLFVGDPHQLKPVNDDMAAFQLGYGGGQLDDVIRQGEGPVLDWATHIRRGQAMYWLNENNPSDECWWGDADIDVIIKRYVDTIKRGEDSTALVFTNATRQMMNQYCRMMLGYRDRLCVGDRVVICMNNKNFGIMNGEVFTIKKFTERTIMGLCKVYDVEFNERPGQYQIHQGSFGLPGGVKMFNDFKRKHWKKKVGNYMLCADYGFALTVHKAQGSSWKTVHGIFENSVNFMSRDERKSWLYTLVTRAEKNLRLYNI